MAASSSSSVNFSKDILVEILSRLPVKSLFRFKCVSKEWHSIISDTNFKLVMRQGARRLILIVYDYEGVDSKGILKYYSISDEEALLSVNTLDEYQTPIICREDDLMEIMEVHPITRILGSCNGLVLFSLNEHIFLWNPFIRCCRKVLELNELGETYYLVVASGIFYDSSIDDYKVTLVLQDEGEGVGDFIGFALLKEKKWQRVQSCYPVDDDVEDDDSGYYEFCGGPVVNDRVHWLIDVSGVPNQIVYFDFKSNKNDILPMPHDNHEYIASGNALGFFDGCLCLFRTCGEGYDDELVRCRNYEVLVMKEYGDKDSWTLMFNVTLHAHVEIRGAMFFMAGHGQEACLIATEVGSIVVYDVEKRECTEVHECEQEHIDSRVENRKFPGYRYGLDVLITRSTCVESLVSPTQYEWDGSSEDEEM